MRKHPLMEALQKLEKKKTVSFHTPGHKNGQIFERDLSFPFSAPSFTWDTTEIPGTDHLHHPQGVIKESQEKAAAFFGAEESFFLVNGSTGGIYSMVMTVAKPGDELIIQRNSHQSVYHGCLLGEVTPRYLQPEIDRQTGLAKAVTEKTVEEALKKWPKAKGLLLTSPNYYGYSANLTVIAEMLHRHHKVLLVDEAHGSHFILAEDRMPPTALKAGADLVVQSTHKTLPALTQASILHRQGQQIDSHRLKTMLQIHQSSSPSYLLMASLENAVRMLEEKGKTWMEELLDNIENTRCQLASVQEIDMVTGDDPTRLWFNMHGTGLSGYEWNKRLASQYAVMMEMADPLGVLALTTIGNRKEDFDRLVEAIRGVREDAWKKQGDYPVETRNLKSSWEEGFFHEVPERVLSLRQAMDAEKEMVALQQAINRISGEMIAPYPPGIPVLLPGEKISEPLIQWLERRQDFLETEISVLR
ncbi:aminotransferase class I/II-fold pyridoxal phosphate-dependent enzyme [Tindallia californiensis]|uniref:Arginine decarboxylase n=1 Tax=Tindallia californiensis TaxID=159292 RepID=A0A1H3PI91_9FIRM|nr:aminotransferase class I/II-fold pyridoxal phosphate-dependent enzyme [Tindallia californiensis]SDZ00836.1 arginine decarboxylase [Tindallia californiensis]